MLRAKQLAHDPLGFFDFPSLPFGGCERPVINVVRHHGVAEPFVQALSPQIVFGHTKLRHSEAARPDDILRRPHQAGPDPQPLEGWKHSKCPDEARPIGGVLRQIHLHLSDRVPVEDSHEVHAFARKSARQVTFDDLPERRVDAVPFQRTQVILLGVADGDGHVEVGVALPLHGHSVHPSSSIRSSTLLRR